MSLRSRSKLWILVRSSRSQAARSLPFMSVIFTLFHLRDGGFWECVSIDLVRIWCSIAKALYRRIPRDCASVSLCRSSTLFFFKIFLNVPSVVWCLFFGRILWNFHMVVKFELSDGQTDRQTEFSFSFAIYMLWNFSQTIIKSSKGRA